MKYNESIVEFNKGIILSQYSKKKVINESIYQTEAMLENQLIIDLCAMGYSKVDVKNSSDLIINLKIQMEKLNDVVFNEGEWNRFLDEYLNCPNDSAIEATRKIQENDRHPFIFDNGYLQNIKIIDKVDLYKNSLQVATQITQSSNRYDVTILVNGLPLVQIELKKRSIPLSEAFHQIGRYAKESYSSNNSLFKYIQLFVISNGTFTRYFANTVVRDKKNYEYTCEWADLKNNPIPDLVDFTATFFETRTLLSVITKYCIFNVKNELLVMRPYQIAAVEGILRKILYANENKKQGTIDACGYVWHTTGSGKTLTSFKASKMAMNIECVDKVFFVVDRKDLDFQTMKEYQKFQRDSVNGSNSTKKLAANINSDDNKIIVTTIQKLNNFMASNQAHAIYEKNCVLIFDECHRSQFGILQKNIKKKFKKYYQFGFTGTPIKESFSIGDQTTDKVFGNIIHSYLIPDAIRDKKVLKFKVDYKETSPDYLKMETKDEITIKESEILKSPRRIENITSDILSIYNIKTHQDKQYIFDGKTINGFNAMFAVQNIEFAKAYYNEFKKQQKSDKKLKVVTIFSFSQNQDQLGNIETDEDFVSANELGSTDKEFLEASIVDYNNMFKTNFTINEFQDYYKDVSERMKSKQIDLLIVVGMFLTGFDAPTMNTLFVDKTLRYHGLLQAFSRTNRILSSIKPFGNIVCYRNLEEATETAIIEFGSVNNEVDKNIVLEKSYSEYMEGTLGYTNLCNQILSKYSDPTSIVSEENKKEFINLFGKIIKLENILSNYDEFEESNPLIPSFIKQNMVSVYYDIIDEIRKKREDEYPTLNSYDGIEFQLDLLKSVEYSLEYILKLIGEKILIATSFTEFIEEIKIIIRSTYGMRPKEELIIEFINVYDNIEELKQIEDIIEEFVKFTSIKRKSDVNDLIISENLSGDTENFINKCIDRGLVSSEGVELDSLLPSVSRREGARDRKKKIVYEKINKIVEIYKET